MFRAQIVTLLCLVLSSWLLADIDVELKPGAINPSASCGECHEAIYSMWRRSLHSMSLSDPIFVASYAKAYQETGGEARRICLRCHAPVADLTGDLELRDAISREGITCDYCHSIASVDLGKSDQPFEISLDGSKRGPFAVAESPAHGVIKSRLHESAELCAGCHEYTNPNGVAVFSTYSEWQASPQAAAGKVCQDCHMPLTAGETVRVEVRAVDRENINLHNISGMHSSEQVRKAAVARIISVTRPRSDLAEVEVEVANVGSGHSIPTGLPTRKLVLEVRLYSGDREVRRFQKTYQKVLIGENGQRLKEDHQTLLYSRAVLEDNRLRAGERRREKFSSRIPDEGRLSAELELRYIYEPTIFRRERISIEIATDRSLASR
jgi:RNase P subunit RPR2